MMKSAVLLLLLPAAYGVAVVEPDPPGPTNNDCIAYKLCCDDAFCSTNCEVYAEENEEDCIARTLAPMNVPPARVPDLCTSYWGYNCCKMGSACGDPHFQTWNGDSYDFHGECDLVFVHAPSFGHGLGMDVHVRTKIRSDFSYIEAVAVKIGDDVIEFGAWGEYLINGVDSTELENLGSFPIRHTTVDEATHNYYITMGEGNQEIHVKSFKDYVSVKFENAFAPDFRDSKGLLGDFLTGRKFARDGYTILDDPIAFGQEWQVRPQEEPQLFQSSDLVPQYPQKCNMPPMTADGRRLAEMKVSREDAEEACAQLNLDETHMRMCVYDVRITGDLEMAQAGAI